MCEKFFCSGCQVWKYVSVKASAPGRSRPICTLCLERISERTKGVTLVKRDHPAGPRTANQGNTERSQAAIAAVVNRPVERAHWLTNWSSLLNS
jgi:hypothetical protein